MPRTLCQKYGFDQDGRFQRLKLLGLGVEAESILSTLQTRVITPAEDILVNKFYDYLLNQEPMKEYLINDSLIERLRKTQIKYILSIGVNFDSEEYFESRLRIGLAHANIGLPLSLYQCAYNVLQELISEQIQLCDDIPVEEKLQIQ
ncbi:MAG: protoglobin domain-containing protein [Thiohalomonadales bacterium]